MKREAERQAEDGGLSVPQEWTGAASPSAVDSVPLSLRQVHFQARGGNSRGPRFHESRSNPSLQSMQRTLCASAYGPRLCPCGVHSWGLKASCSVGNCDGSLCSPPPREAGKGTTGSALGTARQRGLDLRGFVPSLFCLLYKSPNHPGKHKNVGQDLLFRCRQRMAQKDCAIDILLAERRKKAVIICEFLFQRPSLPPSPRCLLLVCQGHCCLPTVWRQLARISPSPSGHHLPPEPFFKQSCPVVG